MRADSMCELVDGDSVIQPGWIDKVLDILERQPEISCVFGRCIEMYPDQSVYMKVCGLDWNATPGERRFCGGKASSVHLVPQHPL